MDHAKLVVIRMEEARDARGISVAELARRASIDRKRLWYILDSQRQMRADEFIRLCAVMNLDMGFFLRFSAHVLSAPGKVVAAVPFRKGSFPWRCRPKRARIAPSKENARGGQGLFRVLCTRNRPLALLREMPSNRDRLRVGLTFWETL